jgi:hypothetical protein
MATQEENQEVENTSSLRDKIRGAILSAPTSDETLEVFGVEVEIRSPDLEGLLQYRDAANDDNIMARSIVNNVFVPGTGEQVFSDADIPELMKTKFSPDMKKLTAAINRVLGGDEQVLKAVDDDSKSPEK